MGGVASPVCRHVRWPVRWYGALNPGQPGPPTPYIAYLTRPNSGDLVLDPDWVLDPSMHIGGYQLPAECEAYVPADGFWFDLDTHAPIARHEIEILAREDVNVEGAAVHCSLDRGLAVYNPSTITAKTLRKVLWFFKWVVDSFSATIPVASNDSSLSTDLQLSGYFFARTGSLLFKDGTGESVVNALWASGALVKGIVYKIGNKKQLYITAGAICNVKEILAPTKYLESSDCVVNFAEVSTGSVVCTGATYNKAKDSSIKRQGGTTLKIENTTSGGTLNTAYNFSIDTPSAPVATFIFYVPDYTKLAGVTFRFSTGDTSFANYFGYAYPIGSGGETFTQYNGWHSITIGVNDWVSTGSPSWAAGIKSIRLAQVNASGTIGGTVYFDSIHFNVDSTPVLMIHCDDVVRSWYTNARSILNNLNLKSCLAVAANWVANPSYMTTAMLHEMQNEGHEIFVHSSNRIGTGYQLTTVGDALADIAYNRSFVSNEFGAAGARFFAFANGQYWINSRTETAILDGMQAAGMCAARITDTINKNRSEPHALSVNNLFLLNEIGPWSGDSVATLNSRIDALIDRGDLGIEVYHGPFPDVAGFTQHMEYIASKVRTGELRVMTFSQWYDGLRSNGTLIGMPAF